MFEDALVTSAGWPDKLRDAPEDCQVPLAPDASGWLQRMGQPSAHGLLPLDKLHPYHSHFSYGKIRCLEKLNYPCKFYPPLQEPKSKNTPEVHDRFM